MADFNVFDRVSVFNLGEWRHGVIARVNQSSPPIYEVRLDSGNIVKLTHHENLDLTGVIRLESNAELSLDAKLKMAEKVAVVNFMHMR